MTTVSGGKWQEAVVHHRNVHGGSLKDAMQNSACRLGYWCNKVVSGGEKQHFSAICAIGGVLTPSQFKKKVVDKAVSHTSGKKAKKNMEERMMKDYHTQYKELRRFCTTREDTTVVGGGRRTKKDGTLDMRFASSHREVYGGGKGRRKRRRRKKQSKRSHTAAHLAMRKESSKCANWDPKRQCVMDPTKRRLWGTKAACVEPGNIAGDRKSQVFSDGFCYDNNTIRAKMRALDREGQTDQIFRSLRTDIGDPAPRFTLEDARKMDSSRLQNLIELQLFAGARQSVRENMQRKEAERMSEMYSRYSESWKKKTKDKGPWWKSMAKAAGWKSLSAVQQAGAWLAITSGVLGMKISELIISNPRTAIVLLKICRVMVRQLCRHWALASAKVKYMNVGYLRGNRNNERSEKVQAVRKWNADDPAAVKDILVMATQKLGTEGWVWDKVKSGAKGIVKGTLSFIGDLELPFVSAIGKKGLAGVDFLVDGFAELAKDAVEMKIYQDQVIEGFGSLRILLVELFGLWDCRQGRRGNHVVLTHNKALEGKVAKTDDGGVL